MFEPLNGGVLTDKRCVGSADVAPDEMIMYSAVPLSRLRSVLKCVRLAKMNPWSSLFARCRSAGRIGEKVSSHAGSVLYGLL